MGLYGIKVRIAIKDAIPAEIVFKDNGAAASEPQIVPEVGTGK
jgi:hypothetical protein